MRKLIITSATALVLAISVISTQTTYACFCIPGIIWEKACGPKPSKPTQPTTPTTPSTPTTPTTPTTPVDQPKTPETPAKPAVVYASATTTPAPAMPAELPETGDNTTLVIMAALGLASYLGTYGYLRFIKR